MDVAEELTEFEDRIDLAHVERRVLDREARVQGLHALIAPWLAPDCTSALDGGAILREPSMEKFGVAERHLPQLALVEDGREIAKLDARYLWISGSNGRLDLTGSIGHVVIDDRSESFEGPSWSIAAFLARRDEVPLTAESFRRVLR